MRYGRRMVPFALGLLAGVVVLALPEPALAKGKGAVHAAPLEMTNTGKTKSGSGKQHCGQRSYSVSVGNPAFKNRVAAWPGPCGW